MSIITEDINASIQQFIATQKYDGAIIITDENTKIYCRPIIESLDIPIHDICIPVGEEKKSVQTLVSVWEQMEQIGASRHSLMLCLGGGVVSDLGGMAAACYKRGIDCVNIPTTLLSMIDASAGGKTGVNFLGLKNEIGLIRQPKAIFLYLPYLKTLPQAEMRSGYAEMLKHALLTNRKVLALHLLYNWAEPDLRALNPLIEESLRVKGEIVSQDPHDHGPRKALNLGHTFGHAFEEYFLQKSAPLPHCYCVAWGLVAALYASAIVTGLQTDVLHQVAHYIFELYGRPEILCRDYDALYKLMEHDKKSTGQEVRFVLLEDVGRPQIDVVLEKNCIFEALDFLREG